MLYPLELRALAKTRFCLPIIGEVHGQSGFLEYR